MKKKGTLEGKFYGEPEVGRFSYAKTRRMITDKLLSYTQDNDPVFTGIGGFNVEDDSFTIELKVSKFKFNLESDGPEAEKAKLDIIDQLEELFGIGEAFDKEQAKKMEREGILLIGYFTDFKEEED